MIGIAFLGEKIFLNRFVDFGLAQEARGFGAVLRVAQHLGFRFLAAFAAALALFTYVRGSEALRTAASAVRAKPVRIGWMLSHFLCIAALAPLSYLLYRYTVTDLSLAAVVALWSVIAVAAALAALLALAPAASGKRRYAPSA